jgi:hypothetical protein
MRRASLRDLIRPGLVAVRANWRPFVLLQLVAAVIVFAYYRAEVVREVLDAAGRVRASVGWWFSFVMTPVAGAILPQVAMALTQPGWRVDRRRVNEVTFLVIFFAFNGLLVDGFYTLQAVVFGQGTDFATVFVKMLVDMLIFTPVVALPIVAVTFGWRRNGWRWGGLMAEVRPSPVAWYVRRVVTLMLPGWCFWAPTVLLIYSMPAGLQIVVWLGAMAAWSTVMVFIGSGQADDEMTVPPPE